MIRPVDVRTTDPSFLTCTRGFFFSGLPSITSVTASPHVAVEDSSDILHVDVENEAELESVDWYYNGKIIDVEDNHFTFPGVVFVYFVLTAKTSLLIKIKYSNKKGIST